MYKNYSFFCRNIDKINKIAGAVSRGRNLPYAIAQVGTEDCMEKKTKKYKKRLAKAITLRYTTNCCDMIAMKREVAACIKQVFRGANVKLGNWRQVTVQSKKRCVGL